MVLVGMAYYDSPEKGLSAPETKRLNFYSADYQLILVHFTVVASEQSHMLARIMIVYSYLCCGNNNHFSGKGRQC